MKASADHYRPLLHRIDGVYLVDKCSVRVFGFEVQRLVRFGARRMFSYVSERLRGSSAVIEEVVAFWFSERPYSPGIQSLGFGMNLVGGCRRGRTEQAFRHSMGASR